MSKDLKSGLDGLGLSLLSEAKSADTKTEDRVDIFKAVSAYYLGTQRAFKGKPEDGPATTDFTSILAMVKNPKGKATTGGNA